MGNISHDHTRMEGHWSLTWQSALEVLRMADIELYSSVHPFYKRLANEKWSSGNNGNLQPASNEVNMNVIGAQLPTLLSEVESTYNHRLQYIRECLTECWRIREDLNLNSQQNHAVIANIKRLMQSRSSMPNPSMGQPLPFIPTDMNVHSRDLSALPLSAQLASPLLGSSESPTSITSGRSTNVYFHNIDETQEQFCEKVVQCLQLLDRLRYYCMLNVLLLLYLFRLHASQYYTAALANALKNDYNLIFSYSFSECSTVQSLRKEIDDYLFQYEGPQSRSYCLCCQQPLLSPVLLHGSHISCWHCVTSAMRESPTNPVCPQCNCPLRLTLEDISFVGYDNQLNSISIVEANPTANIPSIYEKANELQEMQSKPEMEAFGMLPFHTQAMKGVAQKRSRDYVSSPEHMEFASNDIIMSDSMPRSLSYSSVTPVGGEKRRKNKPEVFSAPLSLVASPVAEENRYRHAFSETPKSTMMSTSSQLTSERKSYVKSEEVMQLHTVKNKSPSPPTSSNIHSSAITSSDPVRQSTPSISSEGEASIATSNGSATHNSPPQRVSCHQCKTAKDATNLLYCHMITGRKSKCCQKKYCEGCLRRSYNIDINKVPEEDRKTWICFSCRHQCCCASCSRKEIDASIQQGLKEGRLKKINPQPSVDAESLALVATPAVVRSTVYPSALPGDISNRSFYPQQQQPQQQPQTTSASAQVFHTIQPSRNVNINVLAGRDNMGYGLMHTTLPQTHDAHQHESINQSQLPSVPQSQPERWNMPLSAFERLYPTSVMTIPNYTPIQVSTSPSFNTHRLNQNVTYLTDSPAMLPSQGPSAFASNVHNTHPQPNNNPAGFLLNRQELNDSYQRYFIERK